MAFGLKGTDPETTLRNWLTFLLRECLTTFELRAYHNQLGPENLLPFQLYYNARLRDEVTRIFLSYNSRGRPDIFEKYFCYSTALVERGDDGSLIITPPFDVPDDH